MKTTNWIIAIATMMNVFIFFYSVHNPFAKEKIRIERQNLINITQFWGNPVFMQYMDFKNIGTKKCYISKINCLIQNKENHDISFSYNAKFIDDKPLLNFSLLPGESKSGQIYFARNSTTSEYEIESKFSNQIYDYLDSCSAINSSRTCVDDRTFSNIERYIENKLKVISEGEYECIIQVYKNDENIPFYSKCFYFIMYNSDLKRIYNTIGSLKKGFGIYINTSNTILFTKEDGTWANTTEIENIEVINRLKDEIKEKRIIY